MKLARHSLRMRFMLARFAFALFVGNVSTLTNNFLSVINVSLTSLRLRGQSNELVTLNKPGQQRRLDQNFPVHLARLWPARALVPQALDFHRHRRHHLPRGRIGYREQIYESIDSAKTLVERHSPGWGAGDLVGDPASHLHRQNRL